MRSAYVGGSDSVAAVDDHLMVLVFFNPTANARFSLILKFRLYFSWRIPVFSRIPLHRIFEDLLRVF